MSDKELQVYLIKLLLESRAGSGLKDSPPSLQGDGSGGGSAPGGASLHRSATHARHGSELNAGRGGGGGGGGGGAPAPCSLVAAALQLGDEARVRLLSLLTQRETQLLVSEVCSTAGLGFDVQAHMLLVTAPMMNVSESEWRDSC